MKIVDKCKCPNCGKEIEKQMIRRPYLKIKTVRNKGSASLKTSRISGIFKWVISKKDGETQ